jgi:dihydroxyacetone kinase-like protein
MEAILDRRSSRRKQDGIKSCDEHEPSRCPPPADGLSSATVTVTTPPAGSVPADGRIDAMAVRAALVRCRQVVERHADYLTRLDAVLGDGDHGDNLVIGFRAVETMLAELPPTTPPGALLRAVGHRLVGAVGGASGPLYGTAFIEAGAVAGDRIDLDVSTLAAMLTAAADGLARRGRCAVGDKTILDALRPAAEAFSERATKPGATDQTSQGRVAAAMGSAVAAAVRGMRATRPLVARRGLALRLGERSVGHLDPGAVSCVLLLRAIGAD